MSGVRRGEGVGRTAQTQMDEPPSTWRRARCFSLAVSVTRVTGRAKTFDGWMFV